MRVLFLYPNIDCPPGINHGLAAMSGVLKARGHEVGLIHVCDNLWPLPTTEEVLDMIDAFRPDIVGFSVMSQQFSWACGVSRAQRERRPGLPQAGGGVQCTMVPEEVTADDDALTTAPADRVPYEALAGLWHAVVVLGFAPTTDACVRCGRDLGERAAFALVEGGLLCSGCGAGGGPGALDPADQDALRGFLAGDATAAGLPERHLAAHRRLLARFVRRHVADDADRPALRFWESLP